jgi:hypothetical protein
MENMTVWIGQMRWGYLLIVEIHALLYQTLTVMNICVCMINIPVEMGNVIGKKRIE